MSGQRPTITELEAKNERDEADREAAAELRAAVGGDGVAEDAGGFKVEAERELEAERVAEAERLRVAEEAAKKKDTP